MLILKIILYIIIWNLFIYKYYKIKQSYKPKKKISDIKVISIAGGGIYLSYYLGIYKGLRQILPNFNKLKFTGHSAGAIICLYCILNIDPDNELKRLLTLVDFQKEKKFINKFFLKEWTYNFVKIFYKYKKTIIKNKHRLKIGVSSFNILKLKIEELAYNLTENNYIDIIISSCHIPFVTDNKLFRFNYTLDGSFSNNKNRFKNYSDDNTLFIGMKAFYDYDIAFEYNNYYINKLYMIFPKTKKEIIDLYNKGYNDVIDYFYL